MMCTFGSGAPSLSLGIYKGVKERITTYILLHLEVILRLVVGAPAQGIGVRVLFFELLILVVLLIVINISILLIDFFLILGSDIIKSNILLPSPAPVQEVGPH